MKQIKVESCEMEVCPFCIAIQGPYRWACNHPSIEMRAIENDDVSFPSWCPLQDAIPNNVIGVLLKMAERYAEQTGCKFVIGGDLEKQWREYLNVPLPSPPKES